MIKRAPFRLPRSIAARMNFTVSAKTFEHRFADEEMPDIELGDLRQRGDRLGAGVVEAVPGMDFEAEAFRQRSAIAQQLPFGARLRRVHFGERVAPGAGMQLDDGRAQFRRGLNLRGLRADEQRNANAGVFELMHDWFKLRALAGSVETALGRALGTLFRHQTSGMRSCFERDGDHLRGRRHFEIQGLVDFSP